MMRPATILVTGANGDLGLSIGRILVEVAPKGSRIIGSDISDRWPAASVFHEVLTLPRADDDKYVTALVEASKKCGVSLIVPASVPEITRLAVEWDEASSQLALLMNEPRFILPFLDKLQTFRLLGDLGIEVPMTCDLCDAVSEQLPLILKPRFGSGSRSIRVVHDATALYHAQGNSTEPTVAQAYIDGQDSEFTCPIVRWNGEYRALIVRRVLDGSLTIRFRVERHPEIEDLCFRVAEALDLQGVLNIQLRLGSEGPQIFEINPRFSSTVKMRHDIGFSDVAWMMEARSGNLPPWTPPAVGTRVFRMHRELVVAPVS